MKKLITLLSLVGLLAHFNYAAVLTVSNHPLGGSQYTNLIDAYNAAQSGMDTLILEGTNIPYYLGCWQAWNKSLVVIGIGINPGKQAPKRAKIRNTDCVGTFILTGDASGSKFYGIEFTHTVYHYNSVINNLLFEDCLFNLTYDFVCTNSSTGCEFRNCIFDSPDVNVYFGCDNALTICVFSNCIFDGRIEGHNSPFSNVEWNHCLFLNTCCSNILNNVTYSSIRNSIFMNKFPNGSSNCNFLNNLCNVPGAFPPAGTGNTASGNIENTPPDFLSYSAGSNYSSSHNYDTPASSAVNNASTDGTDIGLHGGYTLFSESGEVLINPIVRAMTILNTAVEANGTLDVQVHITKPSTD